MPCLGDGVNHCIVTLPVLQKYVMWDHPLIRCGLSTPPIYSYGF